MLSNVNKAVVVCLAAVAATLYGTAAAHAQTERFGVVSVQNDTGNVNINYQIKVGNGQWVNYTLAPGQYRLFAHEYANQFDRTSPPIRIRFNSAIGNNPTFMIEYTLQRYAAPDRLYQYAKKYSFRKNDDNYFDLTSIN
jgi:hypothetical protein